MKYTDEEILKHKWQDAIGERMNHSPFKVMTIAKGWAMVRRKGCVPSCYHCNEFGKRFKIVD